MKRILIAASLGIAVSATSPCFGQAVIIFDNYGSFPVQYDPDPAKVPPGMAGQLVDSSFRVGLLYGIGAIIDPSQLTDSGVSTYIDPTMPGYFHGGMVALPGYTSGPITLMVLAWETTGPYGASTYADSLLRGASPLFTQTVGPLNLPGPIYVSLVPEPSLFSFAGLASILLVQRKLEGTASSVHQNRNMGK